MQEADGLLSVSLLPNSLPPDLPGFGVRILSNRDGVGQTVTSPSALPTVERRQRRDNRQECVKSPFSFVNFDGRQLRRDDKRVSITPYEYGCASQAGSLYEMSRLSSLYRSDVSGRNRTCPAGELRHEEARRFVPSCLRGIVQELCHPMA